MNHNGSRFYGILNAKTSHEKTEKSSMNVLYERKESVQVKRYQKKRKNKYLQKPAQMKLLWLLLPGFCDTKKKKNTGTNLPKKCLGKVICRECQAYLIIGHKRSSW